MKIEHLGQSGLKINSIIPHDIIPVKKAETIDLLESKIPFQSIKKSNSVSSKEVFELGPRFSNGRNFVGRDPYFVLGI